MQNRYSIIVMAQNPNVDGSIRYSGRLTIARYRVELRLRAETVGIVHKQEVDGAHPVKHTAEQTQQRLFDVAFMNTPIMTISKPNSPIPIPA